MCVWWWGGRGWKRSRVQHTVSALFGCIEFRVEGEVELLSEHASVVCVDELVHTLVDHVRLHSDTGEENAAQCHCCESSIICHICHTSYLKSSVINYAAPLLDIIYNVYLSIHSICYIQNKQGVPIFVHPYERTESNWCIYILCDLIVKGHLLATK